MNTLHHLNRYTYTHPKAAAILILLMSEGNFIETKYLGDAPDNFFLLWSAQPTSAGPLLPAVAK